MTNGIDNTKNQEKTEEVVKVRKKRGRKPKALKEVQEEKVSTPIDYDFVIRLLDETKKKLETEKAKNNTVSNKAKTDTLNIISFVIPVVFLLVIVTKIVFLFLS